MITNFRFTKVSPDEYLYQSDYIHPASRGDLRLNLCDVSVVSAGLPECGEGVLFVRGSSAEYDTYEHRVTKEKARRVIDALEASGLKPVVISPRLTMGHSKLFVIRKENL